MTAGIMLAAVALDLALGDPPNRWHPVAWLGRLIDQGNARGPSGPAGILVLWGGALVVTVAALSALAAGAAVRAAAPWPLLAFVVEAALLKGALALRDLFVAVRRVLAALDAGDLAEARRLLARDLVSRPTGDLDAGLVRAAAIESLAENLTDSWVAPLFWYLVGGVAAAWAYRAVNTADAMIGHRRERLEHLGKIAARLDDALNRVPARLAGAAIVLAASRYGGSALRAWRTMRADARRTASPNAGWTMAAMAGALGVSLEKAGHYRLGAGPTPPAGAGRRALVLAAIAAAVWGAAALAAAMLWRD